MPKDELRSTLSLWRLFDSWVFFLKKLSQFARRANGIAEEPNFGLDIILFKQVNCRVLKEHA